jgi:hypothetical protein
MDSYTVWCSISEPILHRSSLLNFPLLLSFLFSSLLILFSPRLFYKYLFFCTSNPKSAVTVIRYLQTNNAANGISEAMKGIRVIITCDLLLVALP